MSRPKFVKARTPDDSINYLCKALEHLYLLFSSNDFKFVLSDPTASTNADFELKRRRERFLNAKLDDILNELLIQVDPNK
jgi:hypothetical protein